ncbi:hypothetical protein J6590_029694 [Homalodisca vitripennis]|nr:hypothetical protein J6590_029694 [Homalodisca vitripennis]
MRSLNHSFGGNNSLGGLPDYAKRPRNIPFGFHQAGEAEPPGDLPPPCRWTACKYRISQRSHIQPAVTLADFISDQSQVSVLKTLDTVASLAKNVDRISRQVRNSLPRCEGKSSG